MRGILTVLGLSLLTVSPLSNVIAQENCGDGADNSSVAEVLTELNTVCCGKGKKVRQRLCLAGQEKGFRRAKDTLGTDFATDAQSEVGELRSSSCEDATFDVEGKTCSEVDTTTITDTITSNCCDLTKRNQRVNCLTKSRRQINKLRRSFGSAFVNTMKGNIKTLFNSDSCGKGGTGSLIPSACGGNVRKNRDGILGGWLHKPHSDNTGSIVDLFPSEDSPTGCGYFKKNGKKFMDATSTGRANGNRVHVRPVQSLNCSEFPRNMFLACRVDGRKTCYKIPDPCERLD